MNPFGLISPAYAQDAGGMLATATQFARAIRSLIGRAHEVHPDLGAIDVCIGVSARPPDDAWEAADLLQLAELRLTSAKRSRLSPGAEQQVWAGPPESSGDDDVDEGGGSDLR